MCFAPLASSLPLERPETETSTLVEHLRLSICCQPLQILKQTYDTLKWSPPTKLSRASPGMRRAVWGQQPSEQRANINTSKGRVGLFSAIQRAGRAQHSLTIQRATWGLVGNSEGWDILEPFGGLSLPRPPALAGLPPHHTPC